MSHCNHDFREEHYCANCNAFDQDVAQEMAERIAELERQIEEVDTYLIDERPSLVAKVERLEKSNRNRLEIFKRFLGKTKQVRLEILHLEKLNRELTAENERMENQLASGVHTCSNQCQRPMCVLRRELVAEREANARLEKWQDIVRHYSRDAAMYADERMPVVGHWEGKQNG